MTKTDYREHKIIIKARELRRCQTLAEKILWDKLRKRKLGGFKFRRQHVINNYIVDLYCAEKRLIIEVDGLYHKDQFQKDKDINRQQELTDSGYSVLRFTNNDIINDLEGSLEQILKKLNNLPSSKYNHIYSPLPRNKV